LSGGIGKAEDFADGEWANHDAHDKSRNLAIPSSIPMQKHRFSSRPRTFVVGVNHRQAALAAATRHY